MSYPSKQPAFQVLGEPCPKKLAANLRILAGLLERGAEFQSGGLGLTLLEPGVTRISSDLVVRFFGESEIDKSLH